MKKPSIRIASLQALLLNSICTGVVVLGFSISARAQTVDYGSLETLFGEPVTTSATGQPQRAPDVPVTMEIITADDIRRSGATTIPEVLRNVNGISLWQWSRLQADLDVRGGNQHFSSRMLVLVNGRQVYLDHYGITIWEAIPVQMGEIRQIEVVKGPNTALFGFNAADGVINIVTYNPLYDNKSEAKVTVGTGAYRQTDVMHTVNRNNKAAFRVSGSGKKMHEFDSNVNGTEDPSTFVDPVRAAFNVDAIGQLTDNSQLRIEASRALVNQNSMIPSFTLAEELYETRSAKAAYAVNSSAGLIKASVYKNWMELKVSGLGSPIHMDNAVTVAQLEDLFKIGNSHTFRIMGEFRDNFFESGGDVAVSYQTYGLSGMWNWAIRDDLNWTNAIRADTLDLSHRGDVAPDHNFDQRYTEYSYNSGLVWKASDKDTVRVMTARGIEAPSLFEYQNAYTYSGAFSATDIPLEPTIVTSYELAWDRKLDLINGLLRTSVFHKNMQNVVGIGSFGVSPPGVFGDSSSVGAELSLHGQFLDHYDWDLGYLHQSVDDDLKAGVNKDFEHTTPTHSANAHLGYKSGPWEIDGFANYVSSFDNFETTGFFAPVFLDTISGYVAASARIGYQIDDKTSVALSGQNLQASSTQQTSGLDVERTIFLTFQRKF